MKWCGLLAICMVASVARAQTGQSPATPVVDTSARALRGPTTLSGIYTRDQAARGRNVYAGQCRSCHTPQSHTGETFEAWWGGKPLSELFTFVATQMPKNDPGSLASEDVADVVAYLLEMNAMPAGKRELRPDADSLKQYRVELKRREPTATRKKP
jgi:mono/diheme cytochrome c family protein